MLPLKKILLVCLMFQRFVPSLGWFFNGFQMDEKPFKPFQFKRFPFFMRSVPHEFVPVEYVTNIQVPQSQSIYKSTSSANYSPIYEFRYKIHDPIMENYQEKSEMRIGNVVRGYYKFREPNGYIRLVKYVSDKNGFHTEVSHHRPEDNRGSYEFARSQSYI